MPAESKKVRTVVWLPEQISRRLKRTKADEDIPVTTQIETIVVGHFNAKSKSSKSKAVAS